MYPEMGALAWEKKTQRICTLCNLERSEVRCQGRERSEVRCQGWLYRITESIVLAGRGFLPALEPPLSFNFTATSLVPQNPRHWDYRAGAANPPSVGPGRREGEFPGPTFSGME